MSSPARCIAGLGFSPWACIWPSDYVPESPRPFTFSAWACIWPSDYVPEWLWPFTFLHGQAYGPQIMCLSGSGLLHFLHRLRMRFIISHNFKRSINFPKHAKLFSFTRSGEEEDRKHGYPPKINLVSGLDKVLNLFEQS